MPLVPAKCTSCGAMLNVDDNKDAAVCPYCGTAYIVEKAIDLYQFDDESDDDQPVRKQEFEIRVGVLLAYNGAKTKVVIPKGVSEIDEDVFKDCTALTEVIIPEGVYKIGDYAFAYCANLLRVSLPKTLKSIGEGAFFECSQLREIQLPEALAEIGSSAFSCCGIRCVDIPGSVSEIPYQCFHVCTELTNVILHRGTKNIGIEAFHTCSKLKEIELPDGLKQIGQSAFFGCCKLTSVCIPEGVTWIGGQAFHLCTELTELSIPDSVHIADDALNACTSLKQIQASEVWKKANLRGKLNKFRPVKEGSLRWRWRQFRKNLYYFLVRHAPDWVSNLFSPRYW